MPVKRLPTTLFAITLMCGTAACVTNPETGEREFPVRTAVGAGIGAIGGYLLGDLIGGRSDRTERILGAGLGAVAGGDERERDVCDELERGVLRVPDTAACGEGSQLRIEAARDHDNLGLGLEDQASLLRRLLAAPED